jgi:hypothetical protein
MTYCIVQIHRCFVGDDYVQNHFNCLNFETLEEVDVYIRTHSACKIADGCQRFVHDIRGRIINERGTLYGYYDANDDVHYFAVVKIEGTRKNAFIDQ